jgi:hypothetical protein
MMFLRWRATIVRPGEAKMSPIKRRFVRRKTFYASSDEIYGSAPLQPLQPPSFDPELKGGVLRAPSGFSMAAVTPPEHAHQHEIEPDPMTLTVGSI